MAQEELSFTGITLKSFSRDKKGGKASFSANLSNTVKKKMGWGETPEWETSGNPEGALAGLRMKLGMSGTLTDKWEISIDISTVDGFSWVRKELKGKRGKGKRLELHFNVKFMDDKGCQYLEEYMLTVPEGKGTMEVLHNPAAIQPTLPGADDDKQGTLDDERQKATSKDED